MTRIKLSLGEPGRQGVGRRLDVDTAMALDMVAALSRIGIPAQQALRLVGELKAAGSRESALSPWLVLRYDPVAHRADLGDRLSEAAERVVARRRGRPPTSARKR